MDTRLCLCLKAPIPGGVKTRLAAGLGERTALAAYRAMVGNVLAAVDASGLGATIHYTPETELAAVRHLCGPNRPYRPQAAGDLGARMAAALGQVFAEGAEAALLLGGDLPLVTGELLAQGVAGLATAEAVLGPATDGGYWAIGFTRAGFCPEVFEAMPWSTPCVAARTRERLAAAGRSLFPLPELPDCDTARDLATLAGPPWRQRLAGTPFGLFLAGLPPDSFDHNPDYRLSVP